MKSTLMNEMIKPPTIKISSFGDIENNMYYISNKELKKIDATILNGNIRQNLKDTDLLFMYLDSEHYIKEVKKIIEIAKKLGVFILLVLKESLFLKKQDKLNQIDNVIIIPKEFEDKIKEIFVKIVDIISHMLISYNENDINIDINDFKMVISHSRLLLMGMAREKGENAAFNAIKKAIEISTFDKLSINGAKGVLIHFTQNEKYPLVEIEHSMNIIYEKIDNDAGIIFGTAIDNSLAIDEIKITIIATAVEKRNKK